MEIGGPADDSTNPQLKRKRSLSNTAAFPPGPSKATKVASNQLSINYLARSSNEDLPLIHREETLPNLLHLLSLYSGVLDRHESLASNLGARPLGPILIKRFERCFDAPPKVVASHHKNAASVPEENNHQITWLEVIEFARSHPHQFTLATFSEGRRVCQFYYPQRQLRVQISEEDFLFIKSGRCQELIPPLPIWEDEEKEVSTCDVLEARLKELTNAADMVAARTRQLSHRLKGRRAAILERRAEGGSGTPARVNAQQTTTAPAGAAGFVAVNTNHMNTAPETLPGHAASVKNELLRHFESLPQNQNQSQQHVRPPVRPSQDLESIHTFRSYDAFVPDQRPRPGPPASVSPNTASPVYHDQHDQHLAQQAHRQSISNASGGNVKHNFSRPLAPALESSQPFRPLCQAHMDSLPRGQRVLPPCDRCRRLRMDCVKNLTSCAGCTKKHARCHWRDVSRDELGALDHFMEGGYTAHSPAFSDSRSHEHRSYGEDGPDTDDEDDDSNPSDELEAIGRHAEQERRATDIHQTANSLPRVAPIDHIDGVKPDDAPADVAQSSNRGSVADEHRSTTSTSLVQLLTNTADSALERRPMSVSQLDQPAQDIIVSSQPTNVPAASGYDMTPRAAVGVSSTGGFRAVNVLASTVVKP